MLLPVQRDLTERILYFLASIALAESFNMPHDRDCFSRGK